MRRAFLKGLAVALSHLFGEDEKYFIAATDFGPTGNADPKRWRVYTWAHRRTAWGHIPVVAVTGYLTVEEAQAEYKRRMR